MDTEILFPLSFTDIYGVSHPNAIALVSNITSNAGASYEPTGVRTVHNSSLYYQVKFWHNKEAMNAGAEAQFVYPNTHGTSSGNQVPMVVTGDEALVNIDLWQKTCRTHFDTKVVPTLNPAIAQ